jgi:hypothetical protein
MSYATGMAHQRLVSSYSFFNNFNFLVGEPVKLVDNLVD